MRKVFALLIFMVCSPVFAAELPETIGEWHSVNKFLQPLITEYNGESQGTVTYMTYTRESPSATLDVILTEGAGTGNLYVPEKVNTDKGMMPSDSGFEVLKVSGHDAIFESRAFMPLALTVQAGDNIILTLESPSAGRDDLLRTAEVILSSWRVTE
ncbi:MAG: hypothetical protein IJQ24_12995 [Synergistaceae bacterium]|nr:hypothetical protein [Synergistaceae bacterium]